MVMGIVFGLEGFEDQVVMYVIDDQEGDQCGFGVQLVIGKIIIKL